MNTQMQRLFNSVRDGLFIVSQSGVVRYANQAALRLIPCIDNRPLPNEPLQRMIAQAAAGHIHLPHKDQIELGADCLEAGADVIRAELLQSPVGTDYVVLLHNVTTEQFFKTGVRNLGNLVDRLHRGPLNDFAEKLSTQITQMSFADPAQMTALRERIDETLNDGRALLSAVQKLAQMAELSGGAAMLSEDRIELGPLMLASADRLSSAAQRRRMRIIVERPETELPPVYGSELWISRVFDEMLENSIKHGSGDSDIVAHLHQNASFVMVTVRNVGKALPTTLQNRLFHEGARGKSAADLPGLGLGLPLCQQIIDMHGGHLSVENAADDSVEFAIELPTGAPHHDTAQLDLQQAQRYAQDLAKMMSRRKSMGSTKSAAVATPVTTPAES